RERRPGGAAGGRGRDQIGVHDEVDLVAGSGDVGPVQERVADPGPDPRVELVADTDAELRHDGEGVAVVPADVGRQGQQTALAEAGRAIRQDGGGRAVDGDLAPGVPERHAGEDVHRQAVPPVAGRQPQVEAVEGVGGLEAVADVERRDAAELVHARQVLGDL